MDLFTDLEPPTDVLPYLAALWAAAIAWQLLSGHAFLGLPGSSVSRKEQPEFFWVFLLTQAAAVAWIFLR